jgi:hypothetical protein
MYVGVCGGGGGNCGDTRECDGTCSSPDHLVPLLIARSLDMFGFPFVGISGT